MAPCLSNPEGWDLDVVDYTGVLAAAQKCSGSPDRKPCPMFSTCLAELQSRMANEDSPMMQVYAGRVFRHTGTEIFTDNALRLYMNAVVARRAAETAESFPSQPCPNAQSPVVADDAPATDCAPKQVQMSLSLELSPADSPAASGVSPTAARVIAAVPSAPKSSFIDDCAGQLELFGMQSDYPHAAA